jgi:hypothetical protein
MIITRISGLFSSPLMAEERSLESPSQKLDRAFLTVQGILERTENHVVADVTAEFGSFAASDIEAHALDRGWFSEDLLSVSQKALLTMVIEELKTREQAGIDKQETAHLRKKTQRRAVTSEDQVRRDLVAAGVKDRNEIIARRRGENTGDMDYMDWSVTTLDALRTTAGIIAKMLVSVIFYSALAYMVVLSVEHVIALQRGAGSDILDDAGGNNSNNTAVEGGDEDSEEVVSVGSQALGLVLFAWALVPGTLFTYLFGGWGLNLRHAKSYVVIVSPSALVVVALLAVSAVGLGENGRVSGKIFAALHVFTSAVSAAAVGYMYIAEDDSSDGRNLVKFAAKVADLAMSGTEFKAKSRKSRMKAGSLLALPTTFVYSVFAFISVVMFWAFKATDKSWAKVLVTLLTFCIKVGGNKALLNLMGTHISSWIIDNQLFTFEYGTALLFRIMQLSIPDESTAVLMGLGGAIAEGCVRVFFYVSFCKARLKHRHMSEKAINKHAEWGKMRVQDSSNGKYRRSREFLPSRAPPLTHTHPRLASDFPRHGRRAHELHRRGPLRGPPGTTERVHVRDFEECPRQRSRKTVHVSDDT